MLVKSNLSIDAAGYLCSTAEGKHRNASIHCSYYSVLQYMKYILAELKDNPIPYEEQDSAHTQDSHEYVLEKITARFSSNPAQLKKFRECFRALKRKRVVADYTPATFSLEECLDCKQQAEAMRAILKNAFNKQIA